MENEETKSKTKESPKLVEQANAAAERLEKANAELKLLLDREEEMRAAKVLGGRTEAGVIPVAIDPEQAAKDRINKMLAPTGLKI